LLGLGLGFRLGFGWRRLGRRHGRFFNHRLGFGFGLRLGLEFGFRLGFGLDLGLRFGRRFRDRLRYFRCGLGLGDLGDGRVHYAHHDCLGLFQFGTVLGRHEDGADHRCMKGEDREASACAYTE